MKNHQYSTHITWTGNTGKGTESYRGYERSHKVSTEGKPDILMSSDPAFLGDRGKYNPEDLLLVSLASCHMLWYLHLCSDAGIVVTDYTDAATGTMTEDENGGRFTEVVLHPQVTITEAAQKEKALALHAEAHRKCFIANSCNFPIRHEASCNTL